LSFELVVFDFLLAMCRDEEENEELGSKLKTPNLF